MYLTAVRIPVFLYLHLYISEHGTQHEIHRVFKQIPLMHWYNLILIIIALIRCIPSVPLSAFGPDSI